MKKRFWFVLLVVFSILFLYFPYSYVGGDLKDIITFMLIVSLIIFIRKKFNIKSRINEKYFVFLIILFSVLTRIGIVLLLNPDISQVNEYGLALDAAKTGLLQNQYYQVFTQWILYPKLLELVFKIFGSSQLVALLTNAVTLIIVSLLIYKNATIIFKNKFSGFIASIMYIVWPSNIFYTMVVTPEHLYSLLILIILYLFFKLFKEFDTKKKKKLIVLSILLGTCIGISIFFGNFLLVFFASFLIYIIANYFSNFKKNSTRIKDIHVLFNKVKKSLNLRTINLKLLSFLIMIASCLFTIFIINNKIENNIVKNKTIKNILPYQFVMSFNNTDPHSLENYQGYLDILEKNDLNDNKANKEILKKVDNYFSYDVLSKLNLRAKRLFQNDDSKINTVISSLKSDQTSISSNFNKVNNIYYGIILFLVAIGLLFLNKEKNLKLFLTYLIIFLGSIILWLFDGQNGNTYILQPLMCIAAAAGIKIVIKTLYDKIRIRRRIKNSVDYRSIFYLGLFLLIFVFVSVLLPSLGFLINLSVSKFYLYLAIFIPLILITFLLRKKNILSFSNFLISIIAPLLIIVLSINVAGKYSDYTWDGNMYHKVAVGYLMEGWNPLKEGVETFDLKRDNPRELLKGSYLWVNHYAKASYFYGATVGKVTGNVESGKSLNIISIIILICFISSLLIYKKKSKLFAIIFSIIMATCTTIGAQILTNYVDCLVYLYLFMLIWFFFANEHKDYISLFERLLSYGIILVILINIKFSSFGYAGLFCLGYYSWYIIRMFKKKYDKSLFIKFTIASAVSVILAVCLVGGSVYIKNFKEKGHPFYPLFGEGKVDIMTNNSPDYFASKSPIEKLTISLFSESDNISQSSKKEAKYKIPFSIHEEELVHLKSCDVRISGNGLFFGVIFAVSLFIFVILIYKEFKKNKTNFFLMIIPIFITTVMAFTMNDIWWARYFPQLHFVVFSSLLLLEKCNGKVSKLLFNSLVILILLNNLLYLFGGISSAHKFTSGFNNQINNFKEVFKPNECKMKLHTVSFPGSFFDVERVLPEYNKTYSTEVSDVKYEYILGFSDGICE